MAETETLQDALARPWRTAEGLLYEKLPGGKVRCFACGHRCPIPEGRRGVCQVRWNEGGRLIVPRNYVGALQVDPVEKKPFFHALPGSRALSFGMLGCDYHCRYCQNWITSQALRDPLSEEAGAEPRDLSAGDLVRLAGEQGCRILTSTYNEPLITSEWAAAVFREAHAAGFVTSYVSNGNGTREVLEFLRPHVDLYKVDLKSMNDKVYRSNLGGTLKPVLRTLEDLLELGFWVEVVTLLVPRLNDSDRELEAAARFLASLSRDIPWHVTAFHPDYRMQDRDGTAAARLMEAYGIGKAAGLRFVYAGNLPGRVGDTESTFCPECGTRLIRRFGFRVLEDRIGESGRCPDCGRGIPGVWKAPRPGRAPREGDWLRVPPERTGPFPDVEKVLASLQ